MNERKEQIIKTIRGKLIELQNLSVYEKIFTLDTVVTDILDNVHYLIENENDKTKQNDLNRLWETIDYTYEREITSAKIAFKNARKGNAPRKLMVEYQKAHKKAVLQIDMELNMILK